MQLTKCTNFFIAFKKLFSNLIHIVQNSIVWLGMYCPTGIEMLAIFYYVQPTYAPNLV